MSDPTKTTRLRIDLFPRAIKAIRSGHPWIYRDSIKSQNRDGDIGELAIMYDSKNRFLAVGLYDPSSPFRVRILHHGKAATINREWWLEKATACRELRDKEVFSSETNGARCINGESEGFPGIVVDRYADTLVVKLYSASWLPHWEEIESVFREVFAPRFLVLRLSRNIQPIAAKRWKLKEGFCGDAGEDMVIFKENALCFEAAVREGQKTGFFLDQRDNRARVEKLSKGRAVLNVFSFSGGFSLYAARGGAKSVTDLDISAHALASAKRNFALNAAEAPISNASYEQVQADAFAWIETAEEKFDLIILDPPSLAKREKERERAIQAYKGLNKRAMQMLHPGGILVTASCSAHVSAKEFLLLVRQSGNNSGRRWKEKWTSGHAVDHPAGFPEAQYLKAICMEFS
jgi:23S rRNA (cytosine1962-C5)-methyltransferase|tara:strand:- start:1975 stop:3186 length:1212 start_codon:yes stop_codon:yes gene_type:complete